MTAELIDGPADGHEIDLKPDMPFVALPILHMPTVHDSTEEKTFWKAIYRRGDDEQWRFEGWMK